MYSAWVGIGLGIAALIWLSILSYFFYKEKSFFQKIFPKKDTNKDAAFLIRDNFEKFVESLEGLYKKEENLNKKFKSLALDGLSHFQKFEISKYNPYADTGGNQSFSLVLLDGKQNGLVLTSLHSRSGTRIYIKPVEKGKAQLELSKEEQETLKKALK